MSTKKTEKIEVRIPAELKRAFKARCDAAGMTASEVLRAYAEGQLSVGVTDPRQTAASPQARYSRAASYATAKTVLAAAGSASKRAAAALATLLLASLAAIFLSIGILKPVWQDHVGLFRMADGALSGGIISDTSGASELLGLWTTPIALGTAAVLLLSLTRLIRGSAIPILPRLRL